VEKCVFQKHTKRTVLAFDADFLQTKIIVLNTVNDERRAELLWSTRALVMLLAC
jgi:hypothetical protein